ncbi:MAG: ATP-binding cassette domain-containing protein [Candidatus Izemoplasmatales bacterium]
MMKISENISITTKNLTKAYTKEKGVFDINLTLNSGVLNLLIGKNGSGKSTLLKCIMKHVKYKGKVEKKRLRIGYAPEVFLMPEYQTVDEFLINIGRIKGMGKVMYQERSVDFFKMFNLEQVRNKVIKSLSNGMRQKINLLQALIPEPKIIILDEPLVSLDKNSQKALLEYLTLISKTRLVIISTHNPDKFRSKLKQIYKIEDGKINDKFS